MRVTSIGLYDANNQEVATFTLRSETTKSRYMVRQIIGMDADELTPKFYGFGLNGVNKFYSFGLKARELVIRVMLNPAYSLNEEVSDLREELYKAISASRSGLVELRFFSGGVALSKLQGRIVKLEAGYFNKSPEAQLTIRCEDSMFRGINPIRLVGSEIPNMSLLRLVDSTSTAPHGFAASVTVMVAAPGVHIQDKEISPDWKFTVTPEDGFHVGDIFYFSSDFVDKALYIDRGGVIIPLVDRIAPGSIWPILFPGMTEFFFTNKAAFTWNFIEYHTAFWGV
jgi:hypothetical protein